MGDDSGVGVLAAFCLLVGIVGGCTAGMNLDERHYQRQAVERGYAQHDPKSGQWQWIEPKPTLTGN